MVRKLLVLNGSFLNSQLLLQQLVHALPQHVDYLHPRQYRWPMLPHHLLELIQQLNQSHRRFVSFVLRFHEPLDSNRHNLQKLVSNYGNLLVFVVIVVQSFVFVLAWFDVLDVNYLLVDDKYSSLLV